MGVSFWKNAGQRKLVWSGKEMVVLEQALAYVCCSAEEGKTKVQRYCRKIYELGYVPICPQYSFSPSLMTEMQRICRPCGGWPTRS